MTDSSPLHRHSPPGAPPGTLAVDPLAPRTAIRVMAFNDHEYIEVSVAEPSELPDLIGRFPVTWVDVDGLGDAERLRAIAKQFSIHPLALEDVVNVHQRAKVEEYFGHDFIVSRMVSYDDRLQTEQLSLFLGDGFVLTFQERPGDSLDPVRDRIRTGRGKVRASGADYLAYALLDAALDGYFPVLERFSDRIGELEDEVVERPSEATVQRIYEVRRDLLTLRRAIWPLREAVNQLIREPEGPFTAETRLYLRDAYDHTIQIIDLVETYRELAASLVDIYLSSASNRMNEVMKVLTIISTIFIPLTFIAGIYGMNFQHMPELEWRYGYGLCLAFMAVTALFLIRFFYRKGWLRKKDL